MGGGRSRYFIKAKISHTEGGRSRRGPHSVVVAGTCPEKIGGGNLPTGSGKWDGQPPKKKLFLSPDLAKPFRTNKRTGRGRSGFLLLLDPLPPLPLPPFLLLLLFCVRAPPAFTASSSSSSSAIKNSGKSGGVAVREDFANNICSN